MDRAREWRLLGRWDVWGVQTAVRLMLAIGAVFFLLLLASLTLGAEQVLPAVPISIGELATALLSMAFVVLILPVAMRVRAIITGYDADGSEVATPLSGLVYWSLVYGTVIIAYEGLHGAVSSLVHGSTLLWAYDLTFFALGVFVLLLTGYHLFSLLNPLAEVCTEKFTAEPVQRDGTVQTTLPSETPQEEPPTAHRRW